MKPDALPRGAEEMEASALLSLHSFVALRLASGNDGREHVSATRCLSCRERWDRAVSLLDDELARLRIEAMMQSSFNGEQEADMDSD